MASAYLTRTPSGGNYKIATFSAWVKRSNISSGEQHLISFRSNDTYQFNIKFKSDDTIRLTDYAGATNMQIDTNRVFRDTNAWYHIVASFDSTQSTASNRAKLWINGVQETSFSTATYPSLNGSMQINGNISSNLVGTYSSSNYYFDGSMSHVHWIDGTQYQASDFGETDSTTGIWKPKTAPSVTYGTNGFFLKFENSAAMGTDSSGNSNTFTVNGSMTQLIDTPSNVFAVWNRLDTNSSATLSNGNTTFATSSNNSYEPGKCTLGFSSGKYYVEHKLTSTIGYALLMGIYKTNLNGQDQTSMDSGRYVYNCGNGSILSTSGGTLQSGLATLTNGDILGIAVDCDNGTIDFYKNGSQVGTTVTNSEISSNEWTFGSQPRLSTTVSSNFGNGYFGTTAVTSAQNPTDGIGIFEYTPPTNYRALCTKSINAQEYS